MSIQWYPGHMTKARREIAESMRDQDVIIEVLDARMPRASENPMIAALRRDKPCIKVLTKSDVADPSVTEAWLAHLTREAEQRAIAIRSDKASDTRKRITDLCVQIAKPRGKRALHGIIVGIPNVGKSTLVNTLMGRRVATAADKPAVTKQQQLVVLEGGIVLRDTPGIMWPKIEDPRAGLRLALAGAIPDTAIDIREVALFAAETLSALYPDALRARYKLDALPETPMETLELFGRKRGRLRAGGVVDLHAAAEDLVHAFRSGALGKISLESP